MKKTITAIKILVGVVVLLSSAASAQWGLNGIPVCTAGDMQENPAIAGVHSGCTIIAWRDFRGSNYDIYAQCVDYSGYVQWTANGIVISTATGNQSSPVIASDAPGGAIIAWESSGNIYAERVDCSGNTLWGTGQGIIVCNSGDANGSPVIISDGYGGAIIAWEEGGLETDIYAERVNGSGNPLWGTGCGVHVGFWNHDQSSPCLVSDGSGGAIIAFQDNWWTAGALWDIYAVRIHSSGTEQWEDYICTAFDHQGPPSIISDGSHGAIIAWGDNRAVQGIYAQRVTSVGGILWTLDGVLVSYYPTGYLDWSPDMCTDGSSGAIIAWESGSSLNCNIYAQRVDDSGNVLWGGSSGFPISTATGSQRLPEIVSNGYGSAIIAWRDFRNGVDYDVYAQRIDGLSNILWRYNGLAVCTAGGSQNRSKIASAGSGAGAIITWMDGRSGAFNEDIYAQRVFAEGFVCPAPASILYVDADATGSGDGTSWGNAITELQIALSSALMCGGVTEIWVAAGTYMPTPGIDRLATFQLSSGVGVYGGFAGTEVLRSERDWVANTTILSGDIGVVADSTDNSYHVVKAWNTNSTAVLDGFAVTKGNADGAIGGNDHGGGMSTHGDPTIINVTFLRNSGGSGGGMYNADSDPTLTNVVFSGNSATVGGAIYNVNSYPVLTNVTFNNNSANNGGGIYNTKSTPTLTNVILWDNGSEIYNGLLGNAMISFSLIEGSGGSGPGWDSGLGTDGGGNIDSDPQFKGTYSPDSPLAVWSSSPAINAGSNAAVPIGVVIDLAGNPRIYDTIVDMGAYEHQGGTTTDVDDIPQVPDVFALYQNAPNPFNPATTIRFDLPRDVHVKLNVYNIKGELIATLVDQHMTEGRKEVTWNAKDNKGRAVASGIYFYRLVAGDFVQTKKMVMLK